MTIPSDQGCKLPPPGWWCSREPGHEGPCAARMVISMKFPKVDPFDTPGPKLEDRLNTLEALVLDLRATMLDLCDRVQALEPVVGEPNGPVFPNGPGC